MAEATIMSMAVKFVRDGKMPVTLMNSSMDTCKRFWKMVRELEEEGIYTCR